MRRLVVAAFVAALAFVAQPADAAGGRGDPNDWTLLAGEPTFDPCGVITWSHPNDGSVLERAFARAIRKAHKFSGLTFQRVDQGGDITVAIRTQAEISAVVNGVAYADNEYDWGADSRWWIVGSTLVIAERLPASKVINATVMHELGHALGLDHASQQTQIMSPGVDEKRQYGKGDRVGLAHVGHVACRPAAARGSGAGASRSVNVA